MTGQIQIFGLSNLPEISEGDDVGGRIQEAASQAGLAFVQDDVIVVKQKIVSKAEGRIVLLADVQPSDLACRIAVKWDKDPRHVEVVLRESNRIVKMDQGIIISENRQGMVCANAGVDASNVGVDEAVCLLPEDSDTSAKAIRATLEKGLRSQTRGHYIGQYRTSVATTASSIWPSEFPGWSRLETTWASPTTTAMS